MSRAAVRREPVPYMVAVAHLLRRIEAIPCREPVPLVVLTEKPTSSKPEPVVSLAPAQPLAKSERIVRSVANGEWVIVTVPGVQKRVQRPRLSA